MSDLTSCHPPRAGPAGYGETLTPEQHEALQPILKLAALGNPALATQIERTTPGQVKRQALKRLAVDALREHGTLTHAAAAAGVAPSTIYRWRDSDPKFARQVAEFLHVSYIEELERSMFSIATSNDPKMANAAVRAGEFLLKAEHRQKYGDHQQIEQTININHTVQVALEARDRLQAQQQARLQALRTIDALPAPGDQ